MTHISTNPDSNSKYLHLPYSIIEISGADAERFLQGQTSCDVENLKVNRITFGTANTAKGRMYALFKILKTDTGFLVRIHTPIAALFIETLSKYKVFFKCEIKPRNDITVLGYYNESANINSPASTVDECHPEDGDYHFYIDTSRRELWSTETPLLDNNQEQVDLWLSEDCTQGIPELYPETTDQFILQFLNLHELNAVSFTKGCYTGQEIIARMKYLGKLKKRMYLLSSREITKASPGAAVFDEHDKKIGEIVRIHTHETKGTTALAVLPIEYDSSSSSVYLDTDKATPFSIEYLSYK